MLQYDSVAWNFFALTWLFLYLFVSWWSIRNRFSKAFFRIVVDTDIGAATRTSDEKKKADEIKKKSKGMKSLGRGFWINFLITLIFTFLFINVALSIIETGKDVNSFDPYAILQVSIGDDLKTIKKAYKTMMKQWHPDKNLSNLAVATAKAQMIQKAYEALTDPIAMKNFEECGNPDCKQTFEVSIGLPSWLLDSKYHNAVLISYLFIIVGIIPFCVWKYYTNSSKFGEKDVMYDTYSWYYFSFDDITTIKSLPETFAGSAEFRERPKILHEKQEIQTLMNKVKSRMQKPKYNYPYVIKGNVLMHAHLSRMTNLLSDNAKEDLNYMLSRTNDLVDAMVSVFKHREAGLQTVINCIKFGQFVTQACWTKDSTLLQLPHFTEKEVKHATKHKMTKTIDKYIEAPDEDKRGLKDMTVEKKADVLKCCNKLIPNITLETKIFVVDDEDNKVYEGDLMTLRVKITRNNIEDGELAGLVHAPHFPFPKNESWWIILSTKTNNNGGGKIISSEKVLDPRKVFTHDIKVLAPTKGNYDFDLHVLSDSYIGMDRRAQVQVTTLDATQLPEYKIHPDDAELDNELTLFEEILNNANIEEDSDSDDDDNYNEEGVPKLSAAEQKKMELLQKRRTERNDNSDSEDE